MVTLFELIFIGLSVDAPKTYSQPVLSTEVAETLRRQ